MSHTLALHAEVADGMKMQMEWKDREERTPETECIGMEEATASIYGCLFLNDEVMQKETRV